MADDWKCNNCGKCCGRILPLSKVEVNIIRKYVADNGIKPSPTAGEFTCPFRDEEKKVCTIYEIRPYICKMWRCDGKMTAKQNKSLLKVKRAAVHMWAEFF